MSQRGTLQRPGISRLHCRVAWLSRSYGLKVAWRSRHHHCQTGQIISHPKESISCGRLKTLQRSVYLSLEGIVSETRRIAAKRNRRKGKTVKPFRRRTLDDESWGAAAFVDGDLVIQHVDMSHAARLTVRPVEYERANYAQQPSKVVGKGCQNQGSR